jgi:putative FmdB family regulatory protein
MPTYEYVCVDCAHRFEISQRIGDPSLTVCEVCGGKLRKVFHPVGVVLKGSGFYRTESRTKPKESVSDTKASSSTSGKESTSSSGKESSSSSSGEKREKTA